MMGVGAAALAAAAGVVGFQVLHRPPPTPEKAAELQQVASSSAPAAQIPALPAPQAPSAPAPQAPSPRAPQSLAAAAQPAQHVALAPTALTSSSPPPARRALAQRPSIDQPTLLGRLLDAEGRLLKINPTACPVTSPAMAQLRELQKQAREAETKQERVKVAGLLTAWEQQFMLKP